MMIDAPFTHSLPGKTSPRLFADLQIYDPRRRKKVLIEAPPQYEGKEIPRNLFPFPKHFHELSLKPLQSSLPQKVRFVGVHNISAICQLCRMHFDIRMECPTNDSCPTGKMPLHHFQYRAEKSRPCNVSERGGDDWVDKATFTCSRGDCSATATITTRSPRLTPKEVELLTNPEIISARLESTAQAYPEKFPPDTKYSTSPQEVLACPHSYVQNCLNSDKRPIPRLNRRLLTTMGADADIIFRKLQFKLTVNDGEELWEPPTIKNNPELRNLLDDVAHELRTLMGQVKQNNGASPNKFPPSIRAEREIQSLLAASKYNVAKVNIRRPEPPGQSIDHPRYASLGAMQDFRDDLLLWAYERQKLCDPKNAPYYLECLEDLCNGRHSDDLQVELGRLRSLGEFTTSDLKRAFESLNIDPNITEEEVIIGSFQNFVTDSPLQETQARDNLLIIGKALGSQAIIQAAEKRAMLDVRQAYKFLEVEEGTDDSYILSMYQVKITDKPGDEAKAKEALKLIANARSSSILLAFLEAGTEYDQTIDISVAYNRLGIPDRTTDDDMIITIYDLRINDGASNIQELRDALRSIGEDRDSSIIKSYLKTGVTVPRGREDWPVGLENIGNTCYLNSLLQFYFTVRPLRDMILRFEECQVDLSDESSYSKRVGGRKVTKREVERAKKFAENLRTLFQNLITSRNASVAPDYDLAYLALISSKDEEKEDIKRISIDRLPTLIEVNESIQPVEESSKMELDPQSQSQENLDDNSSETTLVEVVAETHQALPDEDFVMIDGDSKKHLENGRVVDVDKENLPPKEDFQTSPGERPVLQDVEMDDSQNKSGTLQELARGPLTPPPDEPENPPPIPPRPQAKSSKVDMSLMFGRQQDVAECIENVMFQIEAAVKPDGLDENGEQIDIIKKLFYGKTTQSLEVPGSADIRLKTEAFSHLIIDVATGNRDIYSALDGFFDVATVDLEGRETRRYVSISELPPILQIQIQRVQFDKQAKRSYKSTSHLKFPETIYMDRYLDTGESELLAKREECWKWKAKIAMLEKRKYELTDTSIKLGVPEMLDTARNWLVEVASEDGVVDKELIPSIVEELKLKITELEQELQSINEKLNEYQSKISTQFKDLRSHGYRIHSVFIHRGTATFGHYWIYIYDFNEKIWRKYNDEYVSKVEDENEIFNQQGTDPPTPYFLIFVREDQTHIMDAVKREWVS